MSTQLYYLYKNTYNNNCTCKTYVNYIIQYNTRKTQLNDKCYLDQIFNLEWHTIHIRSSFIWSIQGPTNYVKHQWLIYLILSGSKMWHRVVIDYLSDSFVVQKQVQKHWTACILIYLILPGPNKLHDLFQYSVDVCNDDKELLTHV